MDRRDALSRESLGADLTAERLDARVPQHVAVPMLPALEGLAAVLTGQGARLVLHRAVYRSHQTTRDFSPRR